MPWPDLPGRHERGSSAPSSDRPIDFFISYSPADERWATWIAWQLEESGHRTLIQAWDFVPGSNFIDFMDRGIRDSTAVIAVLSRNYLKSRYGTMEWQATLRTDPSKLVTIRVEDCPLHGLLATITYLDLVGVADAAVARTVLLGRLREVLAGRAKPAVAPAFPTEAAITGVHPVAHPPATGNRGRRRTPVAPPRYPLVAEQRGPRTSVTVLHVSGPRFGRGIVESDEPVGAAELQSRIWADVTELTDRGAPPPDLLVVSGDLTESARPREVDEALGFLTGLRMLLGLEPDRLVVVPGGHDVSKAACRAYFASCEAREVAPQEPYFAKLEHYAALFAELYQGLDGPLFDIAQPWTLFVSEELRLAVAGLNSTMAISHRPEDDYGWIGELQATWFAERLRPFERTGWLRLGVIRHDPAPGGVPAGADQALLRDATTLDRLLGKRLNLLLHGEGPGGTGIDVLGSGLPVIPADSPGRAELIEISAEGLRRHQAATPQPRTFRHAWHAAAGTFPNPSAVDHRAQPAPELADAGTEPARIADPRSQLLDRITEVYRTRFDEQAKIRHVSAQPPHLMVTRVEDGFSIQWRVGAHVGEVTQEVLEDFLRYQPDHGSELVYLGPPPTQALRELAARRGVRLRSFIEFQGLLDLSGYIATQTTRLRTDRRYPPDLYVPQRFRELDRLDGAVHEDLATELVKMATSDQTRFTLVLGDFGTGKSFLLREVARRLAQTAPHLIPILIDLRALDKAHSVDGLVAAHLANHGEELIDLKAFRYMLREGRIVLLFDGFDELVTRVSFDRAADHLQTLLQAAEDRAKIVVTSRTQHFKSDAQVFTALGERVGLLPGRRIFGLEPFNPTQVHSYLLNLFGDEQRASSRLKLITGVRDLTALCQNPRMLSFIADLDESRLRAAGAGRVVSAATLYREILDSWLAYEAQRTGGRPGGLGGLREDELMRAVTLLAGRLWESGESQISLPELSELADQLVALAGGRMAGEHAVQAVGSGSLLVRTDDEQFGFIHSSVAEWLVANSIARRISAGENPPELAVKPLSALMIDFLCDLVDVRECRRWSSEVDVPEAGAVVRLNALKISSRLRTSSTADLRGANLRGEDLSYRELARVDLTDADLSGAHLVRTNLAGATMRDTTLIGARLDGANLTRADLSGADLSHAKLARADLTDATLTGSTWRRAALIDVTGPVDAPEFRDAAVAPGMPVEIQFAPASVGVRHGFDAAVGRLPEVLDYSPDGDVLAIGSDDGGVLICDTITGLPVRTLEGHRGRVFAVSFTAGVLVTGSADGTVRIWDPITGQTVHRLTGHDTWPWPVVVEPSSRRLITGDARGVLRLWDLDTGESRAESASDHGLIFSVAVQSNTIAAAYRDGTVRLLDSHTGAVRAELTGADGPVYRVAFAAGWLVTAGQAGALTLWDPATGARRADLAGHTGRVYVATPDPTGTLLASGDTDGGVRLWDAATGAPRAVLAGHEAAIYTIRFSPSGNIMASGDSAGVVRIWDIPSGNQRHELTAHTGSVWPFAFRCDGRQLAISDDQFTTRLWDPDTGQCRHVLAGHGRQVTTVSFDATGTTLATSGNDGVLRLWNTATGQQRRRVDRIQDRQVGFEMAVFAPTGSVLAVYSDDGRVNVLNLDSARFERHLNVISPPVWALAFSPSGEELATANDDDTVRIWYRRTGTLLHTLTEHHGRVRSIAFSPDGTLLATGCDDSHVRIWDAVSGELLRTFSGHTDRVYAVSFGAGVVASASWDTTAQVWDLESGARKHVLDQHIGRLWTATFSQDGRLLATAGDDLVVRLWDPVTGQHLHTLSGHTNSIWSVAFNPAGNLLASGSEDGTTRLWSVHGDPAAEPSHRFTLLGVGDAWAALAEDGRYKLTGDVGGTFWYAIGMCRFEYGELDDYLPGITRIPLDAPF